MNKNQDENISKDIEESNNSIADSTKISDINNKTQEESSKKEKSLFDTAKEIEKKERQRERQLEEESIKQHEKEREYYAKKLQQDKIELIKLKQGAIDHSETIHEIHEEAPVLTFPQKISNFFYHNIWWLWIVVFLGLVIGYITYDIVTTPKPDVTILLLVNDYQLGETLNEQVSDYFEQFIDDKNGDGVSTVNIYYIPLTISENDQLYTSYMTKYSGEMQSANSLIVIADDDCEERLMPDSILYNLSKDFEEYENIDGYKYYLKDTSLAEYIGYEGTLKDDIYIGVRKVQKVFDSSEKMQNNFDIAMELFNNLIDFEEEGVINND